MSRRTTIALAVVAAALLGFILIWERHTLSTGDTADRTGRLLERFVRDKVVGLEIERGDEHIVLVRERDNEAELGEWRMEKPVEGDADQDVVSSTLSALDWAAPRRTLQDIEASDRKRFGLDEPRLTASFTVADTTVPITFGEEDPTEGGVYAQLDDPSTAYVVGKDVFEALDHDAGHFRSKDLMRDVDLQDAAELVISDGETRRLERREGRWWLVAPMETVADASAVSAALDALDGLRIERFVAQDPKDPGEYGLGDAALGVELVESEQGAERVTLRVGAPCGEHEGERYARRDAGAVVCVKDETLAPVRKGVDALREKRLVAAQIGDLASMELEAAGAELTVSRSDDGWRWKTDSGEGEADPDAVREWLASLREVRAAEFAEADDATVARHGLNDPPATLTLRYESDDRAADVVHLGATTAQGAWARRDDEPWLLRVEASLTSLFDASPVRLRDRRLVAEPDSAASRFELKTPSFTEVIERDGERFRLTGPVEAPADVPHTDALVRELGSLTATRFVADTASPAHGLRAPRIEVTMRFTGSSESAAPDAGVPPSEGAGDEPPRTHVLRIGAAAEEGGAYATLDDDPSVFLVGDDVVDVIATPHVDRALLATPREDVDALRIERPGSDPVALERTDDGWRATAGGPADQDAVTKVLNRLGALRAEEVTGYGPASPAHGLAQPRATVTVTRGEGAAAPREYTFVLGATEGEGEQARTHARRTDLEAGLLIAADVARVFVDE